jgi:hypothetical protein
MHKPPLAAGDRACFVRAIVSFGGMDVDLLDATVIEFDETHARVVDEEGASHRLPLECLAVVDQIDLHAIYRTMKIDAHAHPMTTGQHYLKVDRTGWISASRGSP